MWLRRKIVSANDAISTDHHANCPNLISAQSIVFENAEISRRLTYLER